MSNKDGRLELVKEHFRHENDVDPKWEDDFVVAENPRLGRP
jgi:hypothetical protein